MHIISYLNWKTEGHRISTKVTEYVFCEKWDDDYQGKNRQE